MEMDLKIFNNEEFGEIRLIEKDGQIYFVGKDIAEKLGYLNPQKAIRDHISNDDKLTERFVLSGQNRNITIINESGFYSLILSSKLPTAKQFKHWVTSEVLPSIRKTGGYSLAHTISTDLKESLKTDMEQMVEEYLREIETKCSEYYRPTVLEKCNISQYIKKRLGIQKANEEYDLVKQRVLIKLNAKKWEDVDIETLKNSLNVVDESIRVIKADRPYEQKTLFDI